LSMGFYYAVRTEGEGPSGNYKGRICCNAVIPALLSVRGKKKKPDWKVRKGKSTIINRRLGGKRWWTTEDADRGKKDGVRKGRQSIAEGPMGLDEPGGPLSESSGIIERNIQESTGVHGKAQEKGKKTTLVC